MSGIIWLASYPKSGNTWMRVFLTNYWRDAQEAADINFLDPTPIASGRFLFDIETGIESSDLTPDEIRQYRPDVYIQYAHAQDETAFCKVHDAYTILEDNRPLFPAEATQGVVYLIRNPLSVAASWAHHSGITIDESISALASDELVIPGETQKRLALQIEQRLLSWSNHVRSWVDESQLPLYLARYEDMVHRPEATFAGVVRFIRPDEALDLERLRKAIAFSSLETLQEQESENGFYERLSQSKTPFFRRGSTESWREELNAEQIARLIAEHKDVMGRFGYLQQ